MLWGVLILFELLDGGHDGLDYQMVVIWDYLIVTCDNVLRLIMTIVLVIVKTV